MTDFLEQSKIPPKSPKDLTPLNEISECLEKLIGTKFLLTHKTRTDG